MSPKNTSDPTQSVVSGEDEKKPPATASIPPSSAENEGEMSEELRKKIERLREEDPNIYPVF